MFGVLARLVRVCSSLINCTFLMLVGCSVGVCLDRGVQADGVGFAWTCFDGKVFVVTLSVSPVGKDNFATRREEDSLR